MTITFSLYVYGHSESLPIDRHEEGVSDRHRVSLQGVRVHIKLSEREIKKTIPILIVSKRIKYLGINLTKVAKDLYTEKYKILMKSTAKHKNKRYPMLMDQKH